MTEIETLRARVAALEAALREAVDEFVPVYDPSHESGIRVEKAARIRAALTGPGEPE